VLSKSTQIAVKLLEQICVADKIKNDMGRNWGVRRRMKDSWQFIRDIFFPVLRKFLNLILSLCMVGLLQTSTNKLNEVEF
jgi:hypothetical protein